MQASRSINKITAAQAFYNEVADATLQDLAHGRISKNDYLHIIFGLRDATAVKEYSGAVYTQAA